MKENAPLLITLAVMLLVLAAILLPDYFACHPIVFVNAAQEARDETLEASDMHRYRWGPVSAISIKSNDLTIFVDETNPEAAARAESATADAWKQSYARRHELGEAESPCVLLTIVNVKSHESKTCESRDTVLRLFDNDCYF